MKTKTILMIVATLLPTLASATQTNALRLSQVPFQDLIHPERLADRLATPTGQALFQTADAEQRSQLVAALLEDVKNADPLVAAKANFDLGAAAFFGIGLEQNNATAIKHFGRSYDLKPGVFEAAASNADWIKWGPIQRK
ncbi:MAG: hypothetical protein J0G29_04080 [Alphaproteobacteria bacterium]|nr:hypothetical protein [Alphaproteobacteria bacterium]OJV46828.1 MAG: hypothetical protein BGO28_04300 [Alphaproteobacteria bacterium 43-37]